VDIISISFGFQEIVAEINTAISEATKERVLIFAAASNDGSNEVVAWPARKREVLCIHAADGKGNKASFTPGLRNNVENITIPGINVQSVWPPHLQQGSRIRKTGTSCATPIGAGVAAIILDIASIYLTTKRDTSPENDEIWRSLRSADGMLWALRRMSVPRDGYDYIVPWKFIGIRGLSNGGAMEAIFLGLRDEI
jgi:subtilisin family serine protease